MSRTSTRRPSVDRETESAGDAVRRKYQYRKLAINGRMKIPARLALKLVGPDCAYHLYSGHHPSREK
ncbi:MAG: hypothetical protein AAF456_03235 [Planctomycetota bacterium]